LIHRGLKCLILPLIIGSIISALGNLESSFAGKIGRRAALYYFLTTVMAIGLGILLVMTIKPGVTEESEKQMRLTLESRNNMTNFDNNSTEFNEPNKPKVTSIDSLLDLIRNLIPTNLMEATTHHYNTVVNEIVDGNGVVISKVSHKMEEGTNILGLVSFSILLGVMCASMGEAGKPIVQLFTCLSEAAMKITRLVIFFTPMGVLFLVLPRIVEVDDVNSMLGSVGMYTATVLIGLLVHGFLILPLIFIILTRKNPLTHIMKMSPALLTALGTSSSSATLPVTINCLEKNMGYDSRIVRFLVPIGATVNMDGTALYEAVAAIFIAQSRGIPLSIIQVIIVSITSTAASVGAAGIPQAGLVTMVIVLNAVGLPAEDVYLIFVVDWFLDRFRTIINVLGDSFGAAVISTLSPTEELEREIEEHEMHGMQHNSGDHRKSAESFYSVNGPSYPSEPNGVVHSENIKNNNLSANRGIEA
jgi:Na+/H+-dicarboxylate symporter